MTTLLSSETNWIVSRGSLDSAVTFESFDFPIDSESTVRKPPLLLVPPSSSDFEPCEIKLNFTQKHEIRQVHVKSTARIYEIYHAPSLQSDNEYLCTVRCSAASVEDNLFPETDFNEVSSVNSAGPADIIQKARTDSENKIGTSEDDWVEVKLPVGQLHDGNAYLPKQASNNSRNYQDYYEATAEINDSEPCMSLTLRLLSLRSKGCVYVAEVYVFADPIDTNDSENQIVNTESSANSSLMSMLIPTLVGLTKSKSVQLHDQNSSNPVKKLMEAESEPATSTNPVDQQDENLLKPNEAKAELTRSQFPVSNPDKDKVLDPMTRNDISSNRAEMLLEQLVSRVSRIEDICTRFEEKMLKPINNMETRLQRVEQQVELLGKKSWCPVSPSFSRLEPNPRSVSNGGSEICEPDSSNECEPNPRSVRNEGNDFQICDEPDSLNEFEPNPRSVNNEVDYSEICGDPDPSNELNDVFESACCDVEVNVSPKKEKPKKTISVDDAMAAALAGFSSFTVIPLESPEIDEASASSEFLLKETPPEFTGDESDTSCNVSTEISDNSSFLTHGVSEETAPDETDAELVKQESTEAVKVLTVDKHYSVRYYHDQPTPIATESRVDSESPILELKLASLENGSLEFSFKDLLSNRTTDEGVLIDKEKTTTTASTLSMDLGSNNVSTEILDNSSSHTYIISEETGSHEIDAEVIKQESNEVVNDIVRYFPDQPTPIVTKSGVDFESPILEVKFVSLENGSFESSLKDLLSDGVDDEGVLIDEEKASTTASNLLVDLGGDDVVEGMQKDLMPLQLETSFASLI